MVRLSVSRQRGVTVDVPLWPVHRGVTAISLAMRLIREHSHRRMIQQRWQRDSHVIHICMTVPSSFVWHIIASVVNSTQWVRLVWHWSFCGFGAWGSFLSSVSGRSWRPAACLKGTHSHCLGTACQESARNTTKMCVCACVCVCVRACLRACVFGLASFPSLAGNSGFFTWVQLQQPQR